MEYKTGDKIQIGRHTFIIDLTDITKNHCGLFSIKAYEGTVVATNCQLSNSNCTLLVKVGIGYLFVVPDQVSLAEPPKHYVWVLGVKIGVTKCQYESIKDSEDSEVSFCTGTIPVKEE